MRFHLVNKREWHKWFAWHPVVIWKNTGTSYVVLFETVERQVSHNGEKFYQELGTAEREADHGDE